MTIKTLKLYADWLIHINWIMLLYGTIQRVVFGHMQIHELQPGLFQSSKYQSKDFAKLEAEGIGAIIDLEGGVDDLPNFVPLGKYKYWPIHDEPILPNLNDLDLVAQWGYDNWKSGLNVLVHCNAGCNRSGLVDGVILHKNGLSGKEALDLIRKKVPGGLSNIVFAEYIKSL